MTIPMAIPERKILLVYNADRGYINAVFSSLHKAVSPQTYSCELCRTTYGMTGMLRSWKDYLGEQSDSAAGRRGFEYCTGRIQTGIAIGF